MRKLVNYCRRNGFDLVVGCDDNAHYRIWMKISEGKELPEYFLGMTLELLNEDKDLMFVTINRREVLDITLCGQRIRTRVKEWRVSHEAFLLDHKMIIATFSEVAPKGVWIRNTRKIDWVDFSNELQIKMDSFKSRCDSWHDLGW